MLAFTGDGIKSEQESYQTQNVTDNERPICL